MCNPQIKYLVINMLKSNFGKGPDSVKVNISENIIVLDIKGSLTPLEISLLKCNPDNKEVIKKIRKELFDYYFNRFQAEIQRVMDNSNIEMENYTFEIDYNNDRQIMVLIFNQSLE